MNKFVKRCLITGLIMMVAGGAMAVTAVSYGASIWDLTPNGAIRWRNTLEDFSFDNMDYKYESGPTDDFSYLDFEEPAEKGSQIYTTGMADSLSAEIRTGRLIIKEDPDVSEITIYSNKQKNSWHIEEDNGTLKLKTDSGLSLDDDDLVMTVSVPKGFQFSDVYLEVSRRKGLGKKNGVTPAAICRSLSADDMRLEANAGAISVNKGNVNDLNIECNVGAVEYIGTTTGDINGECRVGAVKLSLSGKKEDYNYKFQSSLGAIKIADDQMAFIASGDKWDYSADKDMSLDCSTGAIEVNFY